MVNRSKFAAMMRWSVAPIAVIAMTGCESNTSLTDGMRTADRSDTSMTARPAARPENRMNNNANSGRTEMRGDMAYNSTALPTGDPKTSTIMLERGTPAQVRLGRPFEYELTVKNLTSNSVSSVVLTDVCGDNMNILESVPAVSTNAGGIPTWNIGTLGPNESATIRVMAEATGGDTIDSCASASWDTTLCSTMAVVEPSLRLVKTCAPKMVSVCDNVEYTYEVYNDGTGTIENVMVRDMLGEGVRTIDGARSIEQNMGSLAPGERKTFTVGIDPQSTGTFASMATAEGEGLTAESTQCEVTVGAPILQVEQTAREMQIAGRPVEQCITVRNVGDMAATGVSIDVSIPSWSEMPQASGITPVDGGFRVALPDLAPGEEREVCFNMATTRMGTDAVTVNARAECAEAVSSRVVTEVKGIPAILLEVVDLEDPVIAGENTTYVIKVTNQGFAADNDIVIECITEANQRVLSASGPAGENITGSGVTFNAYPTLGPKDVIEYRVTVKNESTGDVRFTVNMTSRELTRPVMETEATNVYE